MRHLFWICWCLEIATVTYKIIEEIGLPYEPQPLCYYLGLYLMIVLAVRFAFDMQRISTILVALPALPLLTLAGIFSFARFSKKKVTG